MNGEAVLVDTSCWIEAMRRRGDPEIRARVASLVEEGAARLADLVRLELWNGVRGEDERRFLTELETVVETVPTTDQVWVEARSLAVRARATGLTVPATDVLISAVARVHQLELFHRDDHLRRLDELGS